MFKCTCAMFKFKLNNDLSCPDNKKNDRHLQTVCMFCAITSLLVRFRKSLYMAFEDDTSVENKRPFLRFYRSQNQLQILLEFGPLQGIFGTRVNFEANFFSFPCLTKKYAYGFDRMLLETALGQVSNEIVCSKWSQTATLDFYSTVLAFPLLKNSTGIERTYFESPARI